MITSLQISDTKNTYEASEFVKEIYSYKQFVIYYHEHVFKETIRKFNSNIKVVYVNF